jgi:hypothetical protein
MTQRHRTVQSLEMAILDERLRQARYSFNMSLVSATACMFAGCISMVVSFTGKLPEGSYIAMGAMPSLAACLQSAKEANDRLDKILEELGEDKERN